MTESTPHSLDNFAKRPTKGRGAVSALAHRYSSEQRERFDDGWENTEQNAADGLEPATALETQVIWEQARSAISKNDSPDIPLSYGLNPYRGCEHGCIYCYARPTHSYLNLSPGLDFESKIIAKSNIAEVLRKDLARKGYQARAIMLGSATDCYQPVERKLGLTRQVLEVLRDTSHPFGLVTKSAGSQGLLRDLDIISPMAQLGLAAVFVSICTLDAQLARRLEPRAASPQRRLQLIAQLVSAGIPTGVSLAPQIPFLTQDMEQVLQAAQQAGASSAFYSIVRLPWEVLPLFKEWLQAHYPERAQRVMAHIKELHGGKEYRSTFGLRRSGTGVYSQLLAQRFLVAKQRLHLMQSPAPLRCDLFVPPKELNNKNKQLSLF